MLPFFHNKPHEHEYERLTTFCVLARVMRGRIDVVR